MGLELANNRETQLKCKNVFWKSEMGKGMQVNEDSYAVVRLCCKIFKPKLGVLVLFISLTSVGLDVILHL